MEERQRRNDMNTLNGYYMLQDPHKKVRNPRYTSRVVALSKTCLSIYNFPFQPRPPTGRVISSGVQLLAFFAVFFECRFLKRLSATSTPRKTAEKSGRFSGMSCQQLWSTSLSSFG